MKFWYRFVCAFVAVVVVLFSVRVPDVDAVPWIDIKIDDFIISESKFTRECTEGGIMSDRLIADFENYVGSIDDYYFIFLSPSASSYIDCSCTYIKKSDITIDNFYYDSVHDYYVVDFEYIYLYADFALITSGNEIDFQYQGTFNFIFNYDNTTGEYTVNRPREVYGPNGVGNVNTTSGIFTNLFDGDFNKLTFTYDNDFSVGMDLTTLPQQFTLTATNETDNAYNYCIYISSQPASVGIVNSLQSANYFLSSKQWCYVFQQDYQLDADLIDQIKNNVSDNYTTTDIIDYMLRGAPITNLTNVWGGVYNGAKEYIALKNNSMSFYSLVQTNCPVYLIRSNSTRSHVVDYASLNVNLDTQYYLNIIYYQPDMNVVGAIGSSTAALVSAATGEDMIYPIYNVDFFRDYTVYDSIPFSFINGTFSISEDDVTKYNDVVQNSNPANSTANISSDDDNVNINNSSSYDSSVKTNYYNYGTIYHNCSWSGSGGSSSGARPSVPELPEAEFENLYEQSGNFFDFVADVLDAVGAVPMLFITAAFAVLLFLRIWGR